MHITHKAELLRVHSKRGTENTHAAVVIQLAVRLDRMSEVTRGQLMGYTGEEIDVTFRATPHADPGRLPLDVALEESSGGREERMRPGPTERCTNCGELIGDDPGAGFHTPLAGPPTPLCGACALEEEDRLVAAQAEEDEAASDTATTTEGEGSDAPIGDGPLPEPPDGHLVVTTPIRRGRARAASVT